MKDNKKLVYVGFAFPHHKGLHCGYHQIKESVNYDYIIEPQSYFDKMLRPASSKISQFVRNQKYKIFGASFFPWYVIRCWLLGLFNKNLTFHFIYSESMFLPFHRFVGSKNKAVITVHQPLEILDEWKLSKSLKNADEVILVGNAELNLFKARTGRNNVTYIPHGITTDFYHPIENIKKEKIILTVGDWLRDYEFANKVYHRLLATDPDVRIIVVTLPKNKQYIDVESDRFEFRSGITDEELRDLYLKSSILFLPLIRYTANNSLLEAGACGCNIVISSDYPDNSYIPEKYLKIVGMNVDDTVNTLLSSFVYNYNHDLAKFVYENYSWAKIGELTEKLLKK